ncbi:MAG: hypothetical protein MPW15_05185 [Candidatus Manganitrophus sp.]|nr:hypothetical protein [Candidatus Manganitrophus sp.]
MVSATDAWAVTNTREIYHYSSGAWGLNTTLTRSGSLKGVSFANATNGWAVGRVVNGGHDEAGLLLQRDNLVAASNCLYSRRRRR